MIGKWIRSLPFIFANKNYTLTKGTYKITLYVKNGKGVQISKTKSYKVK